MFAKALFSQKIHRTLRVKTKTPKLPKSVHRCKLRRITMSVSLENLEKFATLLHKVQRVKRFAKRPNEKEFTNTAEHTFEVAMMSWYIASVEGLDLDFEKILKYALAHDLIEAYAGDTPAFDTIGQKDKTKREEAAIARIKSEFTEFADLLNIINSYENKNDPESKFVYATDKIVDPLNLSMDDNPSFWKDSNISYQTLRNYKDSKIAKDPTVTKIWKLLIEKLEVNLKRYFNN